MSRVGKLIRKARAKRGWSLREAAKRAACSHVYIGEIERGNRGVSAERAITLAEALCIPREYMQSAWGLDGLERHAAKWSNAQQAHDARKKDR